MPSGTFDIPEVEVEDLVSPTETVFCMCGACFHAFGPHYCLDCDDRLREFLDTGATRPPLVRALKSDEEYRVYLTYTSGQKGVRKPWAEWTEEELSAAFPHRNAEELRKQRPTPYDPTIGSFGSTYSVDFIMARISLRSLEKTRYEREVVFSEAVKPPPPKPVPKKEASAFSFQEWNYINRRSSLKKTITKLFGEEPKTTPRLRRLLSDD